MGVGGSFWDLLKPYARIEGFDFLRDKRVAVDLSFWIVQHQTAIGSSALNPHLRLTFFRTINLFSKFGAFPVFVADGTPSPLKSQARVARYYRASGVDTSTFPAAGEEGVSSERNWQFTKCVKECTELLELLGMPLLKASGEAEALCAQLNYEGHVDACITADSDVFLFGAKCVIKSLRPNSKEPIECYHMSDIEAGLGLKRKHMIAMSLLVGNDHDLIGVQGVGTDTALRFVQNYGEGVILERLREIGQGDAFLLHGDHIFTEGFGPGSDRSSPNTRYSHCSLCGHPGSKRAHEKIACEHCETDVSKSCIRKPVGFKCACSSCDVDRKEKELKRQEIWRIKVCSKIAMQDNFPNEEIIDMYLRNDYSHLSAKDGPCISWGSPKMDMLVDFLVYHQRWEPSYIRQQLVPMFSTIFLREMASNPTESLLCGQYEFDSIQRVKVRFGHQLYLIRWRKAVRAMGSSSHTISVDDSDDEPQEPVEANDEHNPLDDLDAPHILITDGSYFLLTDESMELVRAAFPAVVNRFLRDKELQESIRKKKSKSKEAHENSESPKSRGVQLSIKEFYSSTKLGYHAKQGKNSAEDPDDQSTETARGKKRVAQPNLHKSVRRRLLFN